MQSKIYKVNAIIAPILSYSFIFLFVYVAIFQAKNFDTVVIKLGMSHFFDPNFVDIIAILVICFDIVAVIANLFFKKPLAYAVSGILVLFYSAYSWVLIKTTNSYCGCGNIFIDIDLRFQIIIGVFFIFLIFIYYMGLIKKNKNV